MLCSHPLEEWAVGQSHGLMQTFGLDMRCGGEDSFMEMVTDFIKSTMVTDFIKSTIKDPLRQFAEDHPNWILFILLVAVLTCTIITSIIWCAGRTFFICIGLDKCLSDLCKSTKCLFYSTLFHSILFVFSGLVIWALEKYPMVWAVIPCELYLYMWPHGESKCKPPTNTEYTLWQPQVPLIVYVLFIIVYVLYNIVYVLYNIVYVLYNIVYVPIANWAKHWFQKRCNRVVTRTQNTTKHRNSPSPKTTTKSFWIILVHYIVYVILLICLALYDSSIFHMVHSVSFIQTPLYWQCFKVYMRFTYEKERHLENERNRVYGSFLRHGYRHWWCFQLIRTLSSGLVYYFKGRSSNICILFGLEIDIADTWITCGLDISWMIIIYIMQEAYLKQCKRVVKFSVEWRFPVYFTNLVSTTACYWTPTDDDSRPSTDARTFHVHHVLEDNPITWRCMLVAMIDVALIVTSALY